MSRKNKSHADNRFNGNLPAVDIYGSYGGYKMSDVLREFTAPYIKDAIKYDDILSTYRISAIAWNLTFLPQHQRVSSLMQTLGDMPLKDRIILKNAIGEMIQRKESEFADYNRTITGIQLIDKGNHHYDLTVNSEVIVDA